jgi:hypothetical protein
MNDYYKKFCDMDYKKLMEQMEDITKSIRRLDEGDELHIYTSKEVCKKLDVSEALLTTYRNEQLLPYCRVGDKFFYTDDDIEKFLENTSSWTFTI